VESSQSLTVPGFRSSPREYSENHSTQSAKCRPKKHEPCSRLGGAFAQWGNTSAYRMARSGGWSSAIMPQGTHSNPMSRRERRSRRKQVWTRHDESARRLGVTHLRFLPEADPTGVGLSGSTLAWQLARLLQSYPYLYVGAIRATCTLPGVGVGSVGRLAGADEFHQARDPTDRTGGGNPSGPARPSGGTERGRGAGRGALTGSRRAVGSQEPAWTRPCARWTDDYMRREGRQERTRRRQHAST
jgi:hypothetical protein